VLLLQIEFGQHHSTRVAALLAVCSASVSAWTADLIAEHGVIAALAASLRAGVDVPSAFSRKHDDTDPAKGMRFDDAAGLLLCVLCQHANGMRTVMTSDGFFCIKALLHIAAQQPGLGIMEECAVASIARCIIAEFVLLVQSCATVRVCSQFW